MIAASSVFIGYATDADKPRAGVIRAKLEALGVHVFQDTDMPAGSTIADVLDKQVASATAALILWTNKSVESGYVKAEADKANYRKVYVAAVFDNLDPKHLPLPFNSLSTPDLSDWIETGSNVNYPAWRSILNALGTLLNRPLLKAAEAIEVHNPHTKVQFIKNYPNDPIAVRLSEDISATKRKEFDQRMDEAKASLNARLDEINQKLEAIKYDFDKRLNDTTDLAIIDPRKVIGGMFRPSDRKELDIAKLEARTSSAESALTHANRIIAKLENQSTEFGNSRQKKLWVTATSVMACLTLGLLYFTLGLNEKLKDTLAANELLTASASPNSPTIDRGAALDREKTELAREVTRAKQELQTTKEATIALDRDKTALASQLAQTQKDQQSTKDELLRARAQFEDYAKKGNATLANQIKELQSELNIAQGSIGKYQTQVEALTRTNDDLSKQVQNQGQFKNELATAQMSLKKYQTDAATREEAERACYQLATRPYDIDLPEGVKPPVSLDPANADQIINICTEALSTVSKESRRRILLQLARGYLLRGLAARRPEPTTATSEFDNAVSLFQFSSVGGSTDANWMLGWIFHGGVNVEYRTWKYKLVGTPEYRRAWENIKRAAAAKHPLGLVAAGMYLIWPQCYPGSGAPLQIDQGLKFLQQAKNLQRMEAVFVDGYASYYGVGSIKPSSKGLDAMKAAAKDMNDEVNTFLNNLPSGKPSCPPDALH